jgi:hypothetical protein
MDMGTSMDTDNDRIKDTDMTFKYGHGLCHGPDTDRDWDTDTDKDTDRHTDIGTDNTQPWTGT